MIVLMLAERSIQSLSSNWKIRAGLKSYQILFGAVKWKDNIIECFAMVTMEHGAYTPALQLLPDQDPSL